VNKNEKNEEIEALKKDFIDANNALLVGFSGLTVGKDTELRAELRKNNLKYKVVKNTLARIASEGTPVEALKDQFVGATAITISPTDPVTMAKVLSKFAKDNAKFVFKAGMVEGRVIDIKDVEAIASLPSKEELVSKIMFLINCNAQRIATAVNGTMRNLAVVIGQMVEKQGAQQ
jgi:large subunit ribosomal protein L10